MSKADLEALLAEAGDAEEVQLPVPKRPKPGSYEGQAQCDKCGLWESNQAGYVCPSADCQTFPVVA